MKTDEENIKLSEIATHLEYIFSIAGYSVEVSYISKEELFKVTDLQYQIDYYINCCMSSVEACITDIFTQGKDIIYQIRKS